jgi:carbamoyltransferase
VHETKRLADSEQRMRGLEGIDKLNVPRSVVPSVTHVDFSARVQTVTPEANRRYYRLIKRFNERSGCPMVVNTSFNIRGEPIVCTPEDALRCFLGTDMDALVMENTLLLKDEQPRASRPDATAYKDSFARD